MNQTPTELGQRGFCDVKSTDCPAPLVSVIVVAYNQAEFIDECIASCIDQATDFGDMEIIVADDGSVDETPVKIRSWANKYPGLIRAVLAEKNAGIAANLNQGLLASRGALIAWLGGDDIMLPKKISCQVRFLASHPEAAACYHDAEVFSWPGGGTIGLFSELYAGKAATAISVDALRMLDPRYQMLPSTVMVRRSAMPTAFDERLHFHNDYLFDLEVIIKGGAYFRLEGVYTRYRKHSRSIGLDSKIRSAMLEENLMVCAIAEARYPELAYYINNRAIYYLSLESLRSFRQSNPTRAQALCNGIRRRGAFFRGLLLASFGNLLAHLLDPKYRRLAVKLRSLFG
jgi:glycosyltransferase involved in cell wall biosynthesis